MSETLAEGMHHGVSMHIYLGDPCPEPSASAGALHTLFTKSPLHAKIEHPVLGRRRNDATNESDTGSAAHLLALGGDEEIVWCPFNDWRKKDAKAMRDDARDAGKIPILEGKRDKIERIAESAKKRLAECGEGDTEVTMLWRESGVWCRARPDWYSKDRQLMVDLKTSGMTAPAGFCRGVLWSSGYDFSFAHYTSGARSVSGVTPEYLWLVVETEPPYEASWVGLDPEAEDVARRRRGMAFDRWAECLRSDVWPGFAKHPHSAVAPYWIVAETEEKALVREMQEAS